MKHKVTIIGTGSVGSTIAYSLAMGRIASEIVLIDINQNRADGEAMDIKQATPFLGAANIYAGSYANAEGSDVVVITSGIARKPGQSRIDLAQTNVNIMKSIAPEIGKVAPNAIYIIVSNPVDVMAYVFAKYSGIPANHVMGSGTLLDTARLRTRIAELYNINAEQVEANVFGEHGDSSFVAWSSMNVAGLPFVDYKKAVGTIADYTHEEVETYVRKSGGQIIANKGATNYGIAASVAHLCDCIFRDINAVIPVSTKMSGQFGVEDIFISLLAVIGKDGVKATVTPKLNDEEIDAFRNSAKVLSDVITQLDM